MNPKAVTALLKDTIKEWGEDQAARLGAAVAYYTVFSLAPLLVIVIAIAGLIFGRQAVQGQIVNQVGGLVGAQGGQFIESMIANASKPSSGIIATVVGVVTLLLGATGLFGELQDSLNTIWEIAPKPRGIFETIRTRILSFAMVVVIAFLLLVSLVISAGLAALGHFLGGALPLPEFILQAINFVISFAIITVLFALIYKLLPDAEIAWHDVWIGAAFTSLLFTIGKLAIGLYLGHSSTASTYGAAGALVVLLLWVYYSAQILFFGAEFTQIYANRYGSKVRPAPDATSIADQLRAKDLKPDTEHTDAPTGAKPPSTSKRSSSGRTDRATAPAARPHAGARLPTQQPTRHSLAAFAVAVVLGIGVTLIRWTRSVGQHGRGSGAT